MVVEFEQPTRSAAEAAVAIGCSVAEIAKSIVFRCASGRSVLVIASGPNRIDEARVGAELGEPVSRADAAFVRHSTGYAIGGVPPLGHRLAPVTLIDEDLLRFDRVWAAAGAPNAVVALPSAELVDLTGGRVLRIKP
jgi:prolyl-tRNA editing enzyme YbaK/EbsC (Cys-tRNA(Pro) deacylase)